MDELHFKNFLNGTDTAANTRVCKNDINITDFRSIILLITHLNASLSTLCKDLNDPTLSKEQWCEKVKMCETLKGQISALSQKITQENLISVKNQYIKRVKKRNRNKNKKKERVEQKKVLEARRNVISNNIDNWINSKRNEVEKKRKKAQT